MIQIYCDCCGCRLSEYETIKYGWSCEQCEQKSEQQIKRIIEQLEKLEVLK